MFRVEFQKFFFFKILFFAFKRKRNEHVNGELNQI